MPVPQLKEFLDAHGIKYVTITHSQAFTAQEAAASAHVSGKRLAKVVVVKVDGKMGLALCPAAERLDLERLRSGLGAGKVELATEVEFRDRFPGCELGAIPPIGHLYGMDVYVAESLAAEEEVAFNAGSHTELIQLAYADFARLTQPKVLRLTAS